MITLTLYICSLILRMCESYQARKEADRAAADAAAAAAATAGEERGALRQKLEAALEAHEVALTAAKLEAQALASEVEAQHRDVVDRKSTRLNSSHR